MSGAYEIPGFSFTLPSNADYTGSQFRFVNVNSSGKAVAPSAGGRVIGVRQNKPTTDEAATIVNSGISMVEAGGAITKGGAVTCDANGKAVAATAGDVVHGVALTTAGADAEFLAVLLGSTSLAATQAPFVISIPITLANLATGDVVTNWTPGFAGTITAISFVVTTAVTTGSKAATLNMEIGTTNLTGGVVSLTSANCTPLGAVIAGTAVTAANDFSSTDTLSVEASSVTAFVEGAGVLLVSCLA